MTEASKPFGKESCLFCFVFKSQSVNFCFCCFVYKNRREVFKFYLSFNTTEHIQKCRVQLVAVAFSDFFCGAFKLVLTVTLRLKVLGKTSEDFNLKDHPSLLLTSHH